MLKTEDLLGVPPSIRDLENFISSRSTAIRMIQGLQTTVVKDQEYIARIEKLNDILLNQLGTTKDEINHEN